MSVRSYLGRHQPVDIADAEGIERLARRCWRESGLALIRPADLGNDWLERGVTAWANRRYGEAKK